MAKYKRINNHVDYREEYLVEGPLTEEDVTWINAIKGRKVKLRFRNTKGLTSQIISRINNDNVMFAVDGGETRNREERKELTSLGLATVLYYFEQVENELDPNWTQMQKAMYIYNVLNTDYEYTTEIEEDLTRNDLCRSLTGILYGQLTCAGFALVYQEFMDRLGIKCHFEGVSNVHRYNVLEIDGNFYGIDVTWDNLKDKSKKISSFNNFGLKRNYYFQHGHTTGTLVSKMSSEEREYLKEKFGLDLPEETYYLPDDFYDIKGKVEAMLDFDGASTEEVMDYLKETIITDVSNYSKYDGKYFIPDKDYPKYNLSFLTREQVDSNVSVIRDRLEKRTGKTLDLSMSDDKTRRKYLPNAIEENLEEDMDQKEKTIYDSITDIRQLFAMISVLNDYNITDEKYDIFKDMFQGMYGLALDLDNKRIDEIDINGLKFKKTYFRDYSHKWQYVGEYDESLSAEMVNQAKKDIDDKLDTYLKNIIDEVLNNYDQLMKEYDRYKAMDDEREYYNMMPAMIYSKFQPFIYHEDVLLELNYRSDEIKEVSAILKDRFTFKGVSTEEQRENDIDFLTAAFSDLDEIKKIIEGFEKRQLSEEEFIEKLYNVDYLKQIFDLADYHLTDEDYKNMFDQILNDDWVL